MICIRFFSKWRLYRLLVFWECLWDIMPTNIYKGGFSAKVALREKSPYSELFWSVFSRIRNKYGKIRTLFTPCSFDFSPWIISPQKSFIYHGCITGFYIHLCYSLWIQMSVVLYHLHNLKNVKSTNGGVILLVKLQASAQNYFIGVFRVF